jgi:hypothetical protein
LNGDKHGAIGTLFPNHVGSGSNGSKSLLSNKDRQGNKDGERSRGNAMETITEWQIEKKLTRYGRPAKMKRRLVERLFHRGKGGWRGSEDSGTYNSSNATEAVDSCLLKGRSFSYIAREIELIASIFVALRAS